MRTISHIIVLRKRNLIYHMLHILFLFFLIFETINNTILLSISILNITHLLKLFKFKLITIKIIKFISNKILFNNYLFITCN